MAEFKFNYLRLKPDVNIEDVVEDVQASLKEKPIQKEKYFFEVVKTMNKYQFVAIVPSLYDARAIIREISYTLHEKNPSRYQYGNFFNDCLTHERKLEPL